MPLFLSNGFFLVAGMGASAGGFKSELGLRQTKKCGRVPMRAFDGFQVGLHVESGQFNVVMHGRKRPMLKQTRVDKQAAICRSPLHAVYFFMPLDSD